jgi:hypothetical protein
VRVSSVVLVTALAAGWPAAAQTPAPAPQLPAPAPAPQTPTPQTPTPAAPGAQPPATAAPLAAVPASRKFTSDSGMIFNVIKPEKAADFESVMAKVKEGLGKSTNPMRKQQALSWRVFKGIEAGPGGNIVYVFFMDPAVKDADYTVSQILTDAFPNEAQDLWAKYTQAFVSGQTMLNLQQTTNMSPTAGVPK